MKMTPIRSTNIKAIGYDDIERELVIEFPNGTYVYHDVPREVHAGLVVSESKGGYLAKHIKGRYEFTKKPPKKGE